MTTKGELRKKYKTIRDAISNRSQKSIQICKKLISMPTYLNAKTIALYANTLSEVETNYILNNAIANGKKVCYPKILENGKMEFYLINSKKDLRVGKFNILEPSTKEMIAKNEIELFVIPGVAFDYNCYRLGYGSGFYDRYLEGLKTAKIGLAFSTQIAEKLPTEPYDVKLDYIICENKIISKL